MDGFVMMLLWVSEKETATSGDETRVMVGVANAYCT